MSKLKELSMLYKIKALIIEIMIEEEKKHDVKDIFKMYNYINDKIKEIEGNE